MNSSDQTTLLQIALIVVGVILFGPVALAAFAIALPLLGIIGIIFIVAVIIGAFK